MTRIPTLLVAALASFNASCDPAQPPAGAERMASQLAVDTLAAELGIPRDQVIVEAVHAVEWRDSSLGCPQPGMSYLQVISPGYQVTLTVAGQRHVVHEAGDRAVVCRNAQGLGGALSPEPHRQDPLVATARVDLANRLGVQAEEIQFVSQESRTWNDGSLGCPEKGMQYMQVITEGSVLTFRHGDQVYTYHADEDRAIPCPPIAAK